jgi:hypothetical protein
VQNRSEATAGRAIIIGGIKSVKLLQCCMKARKYDVLELEARCLEPATCLNIRSYKDETDGIRKLPSVPT